MALSGPGELLPPPVRTGTAMSRAPDKKSPSSRLPAKMSVAAAPANGAATRFRATDQLQQQQQQQPLLQQPLLQAQPHSYHAMATAIFHDNSRNIEEIFISAARDGDCERLQSFLAHRDGILLSVDVRDKRSGNTPLIWAAKRGQTKAVTLLLAHGADPTLRNYDAQTALEVASPVIKQALLDSVERDGSAQLRLLQAAWQGNAEAVRTLLDKHKDFVSVDHRNSDGFTALLLVARDVYLFEKLGPQLVSFYNPRSVIVELIQHHADVNICDYEGKTALHYVAASKSSLAASLVSCLANATNIEKPDKRHFAPVHCACQAGNAEVLTELLAAGCSVNCRGFRGTTPLHVAAYNNHDQVALTLLAYGADPHLVDDGGQAPVDVARSGRIKRALRNARSAAAQRTELRLAPVKVPGLRGSNGSTVSTSLDAEAALFRRDGETGQTLSSLTGAGRLEEDGRLISSGAENGYSVALDANCFDAIRKLGTTRGQQRPTIIKSLSSKGGGTTILAGSSFRGSTPAAAPLALPTPTAPAELLTLRASSSNSIIGLGGLQRDRTQCGNGFGRDDSGLTVSVEAGVVTLPYPLQRNDTHNVAATRKSRHPPATPLYPLASVQEVAAACDTIIVKGRSSATSRRATDLDDASFTPDRRSRSLTPISSGSAADYGKMSSLGTVPESEGDTAGSPELTSASPCFTRAAAGYTAAEPRAGTKLTFYSIGEESDITPRGAASVKSSRSLCPDQLLDGTLLSAHFSIDESRTAEHRERAATNETGASDCRNTAVPMPHGIAMQADNSPDVGLLAMDVGMLTATVKSRPAQRMAIERASPTDNQRHAFAAELQHDNNHGCHSSSVSMGIVVAGAGGGGSSLSGMPSYPCERMDALSESSPLMGDRSIAALSSEPTLTTSELPFASETVPPVKDAAASVLAEQGGGRVLQTAGASAAVGIIESGDRLPLSRHSSGTEPRDYVVTSKKLYQPLTSLITMRLPGVDEMPFYESSNLESDFRAAITMRSPRDRLRSRSRSRSRSGSSSDSSRASVKSAGAVAHRGEGGRNSSSVRKDAAITISFRQHDGPVIEDVFESYPRRAYDLPNEAAPSSRRPGDRNGQAEEMKKKPKGKAVKTSKKKTSTASGSRGGGSGGGGTATGAAAPGKQRTSKQQKSSRSAPAAAPIDYGGALQSDKRARSGRRRRGHKKGGGEQSGDGAIGSSKPPLSPINRARESPTSTALISGIGWQLATRMNILEVDREGNATADRHGTAGEDPTGSATAYGLFNQMSPTQKREELKRLLLAVRDSSSSQLLHAGSDTSRLIPETMLAIHEFAKTVPDLEEHQEWDALFGLGAKESRSDKPGAVTAVASYLELEDAVHEDSLGSCAGSVSPFPPSGAIASARGDEESSAAAALTGGDEDGDRERNVYLATDNLDDVHSTDFGIHSVQQKELFNPGSVNLIPFHSPSSAVMSVKVASEAAPPASESHQDSSLAIGVSIDIEAAIDDILASPHLSPRRLLSKTLLAEIHSSWEEIAGSGASKSNSISSRGSGAGASGTSGDRFSPTGIAEGEEGLAQDPAEEIVASAAVADSWSWDDTIAYTDPLLHESWRAAGEAASPSSLSLPPPPRCPLTLEPSSSKPPPAACSGPRTSAHSPKLAAAHGAVAKTGGRFVKHSMSMNISSGCKCGSPMCQETFDATMHLHAEESSPCGASQQSQQHIEASRPTEDASGLGLIHSMAEDILSRSNSRTYTSRLGSRRSARSPMSTMRRPQSAAMSEDSHGTAASLGTETAGEILKWKKGNVLGKGAFATVYCGLTSDGQLIAVKQIELNTDDWDKAEREYENIQDEVELLKTLRHRNIVGFLGTSLEDHVVNIFMQFIPGGTLSSLLSRFGAFEEQIFCRYTRQIVDGISYLHSNNVIHRDIKGANIMLMSNGVIKLIDFGCAKKLCVNLSLSASQLQRSMKGTPYWMAPEVVKETGHGKKSDIWSIGCTVFEMATTKPPWAEMQPMAAIFAIGSEKPVPQLPDTFSAAAKGFVSACMTRDPSDRPDATALLSHAFISYVYAK